MIADIHRKPERGTKDPEVIGSILDEGLVCHASYITDGRPVVIPTLYARDGDHLLLHGSNSMGLAKAVRSGSLLSVAVTLLDGLVLARSAFESSANYRSVVVHGQGRLLEGEEKRRGLDLVVDRLIPGRREDLRSSTAAEIRQTAVIELGLDTASAKVREGGPSEDDADVGAEIWAGVIPLELRAGDPIPADDLPPGIPVPDYAATYRRRP